MLCKDIRLSEMTVCNWGVFRGVNTFAVPKLGLYVTGENATGKSTLTDAYTTLFRSPGQTDFNAAAAQRERGRKGDGRNVVTYMRNLYSRDADGGALYARNDPPFISLICGVFSETSTGGPIEGIWASGRGTPVLRTLAVLFYLETESDSLRDVKRMYFIGKRKIAVGDILDPITETGLWDGKSIRGRLQEKYQKSVECYDDFAKYERNFMAMFNIGNGKAMTLLNKAIGMKQIGNLTSLIREFTLEDFDEIGKQADDIVNHRYVTYQDAQRLYKEAKKKYEYLLPFRELSENLNAQRKALSSCSEIIGHIQTFVAQRKYVAASETLEGNTRKIAENTASLAVHDAHRAELDNEHVALSVRLESIGAVDLAKLNDRMRKCKDILKRIIAARNQYETTARSFDIPVGTTQEAFDAARGRANEVQQALNGRSAELLGQREETAAKVKSLAADIAELDAEIDSLRTNSRSNMPAAMTRFRERLAQAMGLPSDPTQVQDRLPFVAELMDIPKELDDWRGAIEHSLGDLRTVIVTDAPVPEAVLAWLDANHHKVRVDIRSVAAPLDAATPLQDGFVGRLALKEDFPRKDWLLRLLARADRRLVDSPEADADGAPCLAKSGVETFGAHRAAKDDEVRLGTPGDRKQWMVGLSNAAKLQGLEEHRNGLATTRRKLEEEIKDIDRQCADVAERCRLLQRFADTAFESIDATERTEELAGLEETLRLNTDPEGEISRTRERLKASKSERDELQKVITRITAENIALQHSSEGCARDIQALQGFVDMPLPDAVLLDFVQRTANVPLERFGDVLNRHHDGERQKITALLAKHTAEIVQRMRTFNESFPSDAADMAAVIDSLDDYLRLLDKVEQDDIRILAERDASHRSSMIDRTFSALAGMLDSSVLKIVGRLKVINQKLKDIGFIEDHYLQLVWEERKTEEVRELDGLRQLMFRQVDDGDEQVFATFDQIINILRKALGAAESPILDPRQRFHFRVEERRRTEDGTDPVVFNMASTEGQSGGQKESFTGVILAACLGYVLIPEGARQPVFRTIFLDEAFANTKPEWSARVLEVFARIGFQTNIVSHRNLGFARDFTGGVLYCRHRRIADGIGESTLSELQWDEFRRMAESGSRDETGQEQAEGSADLLEVMA